MMDINIAFPKDKTIVDLFLEQVAKTPDNVAVEFEGEKIDYKTLNIQTNRLASYLSSRGIQKGMLIGILLNRSPRLIISLIAVLKTGATYVPIDPEYPLDRIDFMLDDSGVKFLITEEKFNRETDNNISNILLEEVWPNLIDDNKIHKEYIVHSDLAYLLYTSGSTGKPKGVQVEHGNLINFLLSMQKEPGISSNDKLLAVTTISFDIAALELFLPLISGATIILANSEIARNGNELLHLIKNKQISIMQATPATWYMLLDSGWTTKLPLKILCGGEAFPKDLAEKLLDKVAEIWNMYGPTETTIWSCIKQITDATNINIGKPIDNTTIYILDKDLKQQATGEVGEIFIGGKGVACGYLNRPELNKEKFIQNPFIESDKKIYQTGDLGYALPNGEFMCLGRIDDQVKIRGYRIELGEIEHILTEIQQIQQAVVIAKDDGEGNKRLVAYLVTNENFTKSTVLNYLESKLPDYMIPRLLIPLSELPLTANGKIDKRNLPDPDEYLSTLVYVPAKSQTEKLLVTIWKSVLKMDKIGVNDNFFELGGNSLLAQKIVSLLAKEQIKYPITKLYQYPTISQTAKFLGGKTKTKLTKKSASKKNENNDVAVIGMSGRFPGANTIEELWENLKMGKESIHFFSDDELDSSIPDSLKQNPNYVKARGIIADADKFDPAFFAINPKVAEIMDPQQRIFLEICWEALESAGYSSNDFEKSIGVYAGCSYNSYYTKNVLTHPDLIEQMGDFQVMTVSDKDYLASRVAYSLNLKGPAVTVQSACSTSLLAIAQAVEGIRNGQCEQALAGGVAINPPINNGHIYQEGAIFSKDGHSNVFDSNAHGTVFSDGAGVVLLKNRKQAELDGDVIYAVIKGIGINNDGRDKGSFTAPHSEGQAGAIQMALNDAEIDPSTISYIETHGTGTPIGDPIEIEGLGIAFGEQNKKQYCAIGSIKSNIGHLTVAAGVAGFIKTCLSLYHQQIPASINFTQPNPLLQLENSPFYVNAKLSDWNSTESRRAGISSFGIGGTNVHIVLEEHQQSQKESLGGRPFELLTWSAKSDESRDDYGIKLKDYLANHTEIKIADLAYTLQTSKVEFNHRRFTIAANNDDLISKLNPIFVPAEVKTLKEKHDQLAFIFPGQGAQYLNMGHELYQNEAVFKEAIDECADLLKEEIGEDIREVIYSKTTNSEAAETLNNTFYTQPSLFITEYALAKLWMSWGIKPDILIGHSIGEFVAAHLAGIFSLKDGLHLIASRAKLMVDLPAGNMLAVRANHEQIQSLLHKDLSIAAINSPNLCVVAGAVKLINSFSELLETKGIPSKLLHTSHAFHSSMMDSIVSPFEQIVKFIKLNIPKTPIVSTLTGQWMKDAEATDPAYWARHLRSTVRFADAIKTLIEDDQHLITLECGPRSGSTILIKQQINNKPVLAIPSLEYSPNQNEYYSFLKAVGQLWLNGLSVQWDSFYSNQKRIKLKIPTYAFDKKTYWIDPIPTLNPQSTNDNYTVQNIPLQEVQPENSLLENSLMKKFGLIKRIKEILENASGIETDGVDPNSSFIEIGLDSLLLTQVALTLKKEFMLPITFRKLSEEYNSLSLLAKYLDANLPAEALPEDVAINNDLQQPKNVVSSLTNTQNSKNTNSTAFELISQQIQLLSQQVALLSSAENASIPSLTESNKNLIKNESDEEIDITIDEAIELKKPFGATAKIEKCSQEISYKQQEYLKSLVSRYNEKTKASKKYTQENRSYMADPRVVSGFKPLTKEIVYPIVVKSSKGSYIWDIDNNKYIDMLNGFGSNMLGYQPNFLKKALIQQIEEGYEIGPQHVLAGEVSKLICEFTKHDRAALCNTGSEAVLGAMRIARTATERSLIVAFSGSYHGITDEVIVRGTKKLKTFPAASGIMPEAVQNMLILDYGTEESLKIIKQRSNEIAAVLVEPIQSRRPEFQPIEFLKSLRKFTLAAGIVLIFDEVITGFRMHPGGTQALFGIKADIATYGKVVGGGISIGIIAGKKDYMDALDGGYWEYGDDSAPEAGVTYFAGTFVRHPLALATAKASLLYMKEKGPQLQEDMNEKTKVLADELQKICTNYNLPIYIARFGSLWKVKYTKEYPYSELLFTLMREKGIHIVDGFPCFITESHTREELLYVIQKFEESIVELLNYDFIPTERPLEIRYPSETNYSHEDPPVQGALLGKDADGNPAWFIPDDTFPGKYLQLNL